MVIEYHDSSDGVVNDYISCKKCPLCPGCGFQVPIQFYASYKGGSGVVALVLEEPL
jgi:hypothetical protein